MKSLIGDVKTTRVSNAVAAGTTLITSSSVSMVGFRNAKWEVHFGAITTNAVTSIEIHESADDSSYTAVAGTNKVVADSDDNKIVQVELLDPQNKFYKCLVNRSTQNAVVDTIVCHQHGAVAVPVTQPSTTIGNEQHQSPIAGAA